MAKRVKLCAIAMNEGPYLTDWVFHHLYFGFDGIEVWINRTEDQSTQIMEGLRSAREQVSFRVVDDLHEDSLRKGRYFQHRAYAKLAKRAETEGYTHVAFLDLDEYWLPRDFMTGIHDFLPHDSHVNVVSFPWCIDVPDRSRRAFAHPLSSALEIQLDPHVKSVVRLDERVTQFRSHTARTTAGARLLVRDAFPLNQEREQQWGSFVLTEYFSSNWDQLPDAFVLHAIHRSETEYVASLKKAFQTPRTDSQYRTNRRGFVARRSPALPVELPPPKLTSYFHALSRFRAEVGIDTYVREAELLARRRARSVIDAAAADPALMERLRGALHGVSVPALDRRYPGWDSHLEWCIDEVVLADRTILGWAFSEEAGQDLEFAFRDAAATEWPPDSVLRSPRPDVVRVHPGAPANCGFQIGFPAGLAPDSPGNCLLARPKGSTVWSSRPLTSHLAGQRARTN